jgi:hypothetical protein
MASQCPSCGSASHEACCSTCQLVPVAGAVPALCGSELTSAVRSALVIQANSVYYNGYEFQAFGSGDDGPADPNGVYDPHEMRPFRIPDGWVVASSALPGLEQLGPELIARVGFSSGRLAVRRCTGSSSALGGGGSGDGGGSVATRDGGGGLYDLVRTKNQPAWGPGSVQGELGPGQRRLDDVVELPRSGEFRLVGDEVCMTPPPHSWTRLLACRRMPSGVK